MRVALLLGLAVVAGCPAPHVAGPAPASLGERVVLAGVPTPLYLYPASITAYPADDRGAYVVELGERHSRDGADALAAELAVGTDDIDGERGHVLRLTAGERDALRARPGVIAVRPLQPADRQAARLTAGASSIAVRIDLFADASADEAAAVISWIAARQGRAQQLGPTALAATLPADAALLTARLSPVRWVE